MSQHKETLYIVMPAYNEVGNIETVIRQWYPVLEYASEDSRLVIADTGSTDGTHEKILSLKEEMPKIETISSEYKEHGPKLLALYDYAIKSGADYVFQTDSDGQTDPLDFEGFWNLRHYHDCIFGNRTHRGDGAVRAFVESVVCMMVKFFFKASVPDANAPFRLMKCDVIKKYIYRIPKDYYLSNIVLVSYLSHYNENITFREISFGERLQGENSVDMVSITKIGIKSLKDFRTFRKDMR